LTTSEVIGKLASPMSFELGGVFCRRLPSFGGTAQVVVGGTLRVSLLTGRHLATRTPPGLVLGGGFFWCAVGGGVVTRVTPSQRTATSRRPKPRWLRSLRVGGSERSALVFVI